ncbi:MAG: hypothetical protein M0P70_04815 [Desulfobulbaceae bacterium]|nr:hypothetical protein [Desulfobulbaceae bacterium]
MWVINIRHWLNEQLDGPAAPQFKTKVKMLTEFITYVTALESDLKLVILHFAGAVLAGNHARLNCT